MKIMYCVELINYDTENLIIGYATTEEKAKKMIELMQSTDGFEDYEYEYYWIYVDGLKINDQDIEV